jgi:TonB family protein
MKLPHVMPRTPHAKAVWARRHPKERQYVGRSVAMSVGIHLLFGAMVCFLASLLVPKIQFAWSKSAAASGPAPEQSMTVSLVMAQPHPPPQPLPVPMPAPTIKPTPVPQALPVLPPVQLKMVAPAPTPVPSPTTVAESPKSTAKPSAKPRPRYTAARPTGAGQAQNISNTHLGSIGLPRPGYPPEALALHEGGTVGMEVVFGPDGSVTSAEVRRSSGFSILDMSTRSFIYAHWKNVSLANLTIHVPIIYDPPGDRATTSIP